jgi:hypothetical protein
MKLSRSLLAAAAFVAAGPGAAQPAQAPSAAAEPASPEVDPQRLALARTTAGRLFPDGTYQRLMQSSLDTMTEQMVGAMLDMKVEDVAPPGESQDPAQAGKTLREAASEADPHFMERMRITNKVMFEEIIPIFSRMEPDVREALARAYARRYDAAQLTEMNRFFATPTGTAWAADSMLIWMDPEIMGLMSGAAPEMMKQMPAIMEKVQTATAHLPPPKPKADRAGKRGPKRR